MPNGLDHGQVEVACQAMRVLAHLWDGGSRQVSPPALAMNWHDAIVICFDGSDRSSLNNLSRVRDYHLRDPIPRPFIRTYLVDKEIRMLI